MKVRASNGEKRELVPQGTYKGVIVGIYDIGTETGQFGPRHQIVITWELHKKKLERPYLISKFYGLSFNTKSTLRKDVESLLGKSFDDGDEFDLEKLLERPCRVQIGHGKRQDGSPRDEIKSLMPLDDDETGVEPVGSSCYFEISGTNCDIPSEVPSWIVERVKKSPEWSGVVFSEAIPKANGAVAVAADDDGDIPF